MTNVSLGNPFTRIQGGNYSHMERFIRWDDPEYTEQVKAQPEFDASDHRNKEVGGINLEKVLGEDLGLRIPRVTKGFS